MSQPITCFFSGIFMAMVLLALMVSCNSVEPENPRINPEKPVLPQAIILQVDRLVTGSPNGSIRESQDKTVEAVVTIHTEDGKPTDYNLRKVMVNNDTGIYKTEKIDLPIGNYQIITFYVLGEDNKVSDVTPLKNSPLGDQVDKALPYPFQVSAKENKGNADPDGEEVATIVLPALSTEGLKPEDFGLHSFLIDIKDAFYFFVALVEKTEVLDFKSGKLTISGENYEYTQNLGANINKTVLLPDLAAYEIKVESKGLQTYSGTFSRDSLRVYASGPLIIEMGKETIECVGGSYLWDVLLESQTDVANFALRCHTQINGNLILQDGSQDDPIVDLTPLSELRIIGNSLEISHNGQLASLDGLQNLNAVYGQVTVKGNPKLKTLTGLKGIHTIESKLSITNNSSLVHLDGFQGLRAASILFIHDNLRLQNLEGLANIKRAGHLSIAYNESLNSLKGLHGLQEINRLTITGNDALVSLDGFENAVESIQNLEVYSNLKLKDFSGMLSPSGKIKSSMQLVGNTSLASLEGLSFARDIPFDILIEDNFLKDISALKSIEKIGRSLTIASNISLESLLGLENLISVGNGNQKDSGYHLSISGNMLVEDFCSLTSLFTKGIYYKTIINSNGYNPSVQDIKDGKCLNF